jgi:hypothetical protein
MGFGFIICFWVGFLLGSKNAQQRFLSEAVSNGSAHVFVDNDGNEFIKWGRK